MDNNQSNSPHPKRVIGYIFGIILMMTIAAISGFYSGLDWNSVQHFPILGIPIGIIIWSFIGNLVGIIYTVYTKVSIENSFQWIIVRSALSILGGSIIYLILFAFFIPRDYSIIYLIVFSLGFSNLPQWFITNILQKTIAESINAPLDEEQALNEKREEE